MAPPFEEEAASDEDSISVTSTKPSDEEAEYNVEKIIAEDRDEETGAVNYLVKWEGYPLHLSTWEPPENLISAQILPNWEQEKEEIRSGIRQPFDVDEYYEAQELQIEEKSQRHQRRVAKRRRLGMPSRSGSVSNGSARDIETQDAAEDQPQDAPRKRVKTVIPKRKGVAAKVKKSSNRQATTASSSEDSSDDGHSSGENSLLEESMNRQKVRPAGRQTATPITAPRRTASASAASPANKVVKKAIPAQKSVSARKSAASSSSLQRRATEGSLPSSSARKSAPSSASVVLPSATAPKRLPVLPTDTPNRKPPSNVSFNFNPKPAPRTRKVSESDPRHQRYATLSEQNRFHKHAAREAAPDVSQLRTFNPATGRFEDPDTTTPRVSTSTSRSVSGPSTNAIPSVFGRREAPAAARERSRSPSPAREHTISASTDDNVSRYYKVCWDWRNGVCSKPEGFCAFAHHYITCPYWKNGGCKLTEKECKFDHREGRDPPMSRGFGLPSMNTAPMPGNSMRKLSDAQSPVLQQALVMSPQQAMPLQEAALVASSHKNMTEPLPPPPRMTKPDRRTILYHKDIICRPWYAGGCYKPNCEFAHHDTGYQIDFKDVTCGFWLKGHCNKSEMSCRFAHRLTEYRAGGPGTGKILFEPLVAGAVIPQYELDIGPKDITCTFWLKGRCRNEEFECKFAHRFTNIQAGPPGSRTVVYMPSVTESPSTIEAQPQKTTVAEESTFQVQDGDDTNGSEPMDLDSDHTQAVLNAPANVGPASRPPSSHAQSHESEPAFTHDVDLTLEAEGNEHRVAAKLASFTEQDGSLLADLLGSQRHLKVTRAVSPTDMKRHCADTLQQGARFATGDVFLDKSSLDLSRVLAESYQKSGSCSVVLSSQFTLLIYPSAVEEWFFLNRPGDAISQATLRFKILPPLQADLPDNTVEASPAVKEPGSGFDASNNESPNMAGPHPLVANIDRMLKISDTKTEERVFIMMPETRAAEVDCIVKAFEKRFEQPDYKDRKWSIRTSRKPGSWEDCFARSSCLLIVHPDVHLWDVPSLGKLLHYTSFHVFSVALDPSLAAVNQNDPTFTCQRLFSEGGVIFLTDDVFLHHPREALLIIESVNKSNAGKPLGASRNKIATRPGIKSWLLDLVTKQKAGEEDPRKLLLLQAIWDMCPFEKEDDVYPGNPSEESDLVSLAPEQLLTFQALVQTDRAKAADYIINWFAGWSFMNATKFRRFTVIHEEPGTAKEVMTKDYKLVHQGGQADPRGWGKEFQYLLVKTPEQWLDWKAKQSRK